MLEPVSAFSSFPPLHLMGFIIAKTFLYLIVPPASLFIVIAAGFFIIRSHPRSGKGLVTGGFAALYLLSIGPVSDALLKPLETSAPPLRREHMQADAIVVLGGGTKDLAWLGKSAEPSSGALYRTIEGVVLYRRLHLPVVFVGGNGDPSRTATPDADAMEETARSLGVPAGDIIVENKSRNTFEGAGQLKRLMPGRRVVLITSAYHMKRAAAMFRTQGFEVIPAPAGYLTETGNLSVYSLIPRAESLSRSATAFTEYASLFLYMISGRI